MRKQTSIWTTKSGDRIRICDMTDRHLVNTIKFLKKNAGNLLSKCVSAAYSAGSGFNPDSMASYYCDQAIDIMESISPEEFLESETPLWGKLLNEAERRGLSISIDL